MLGGVSYEKVDDAGLHVKVDGEPRLLEVDNVVVCAGQEPLKDLEVQYFEYVYFEPVRHKARSGGNSPLYQFWHIVPGSRDGCRPIG